jgi:hypothetical protein
MLAVRSCLPWVGGRADYSHSGRINPFKSINHLLPYQLKGEGVYTRRWATRACRTSRVTLLEHVFPLCDKKIRPDTCHLSGLHEIGMCCLYEVPDKGQHPAKLERS